MSHAVSSVFCAVFLFLATLPAHAQPEWDALLAAAKKEGQVNVGGPIAPASPPSMRYIPGENDVESQKGHMLPTRGEAMKYIKELRPQ